MPCRILAFDFGASSGRAVIASLNDGKMIINEIHRFSNDPVFVNGTMYWDVLRLWFEIKSGISKAVNDGGFDAISIDTWGVDFGIIKKDGKLYGNPVHYRDSRTNGVPDKVFETISKDDIYKKTGIQHMRFNTLYQLKYLVDNEPGSLENADKILLMPDLFAYFLTGVKKGELTILSTSNMIDPVLMDWEKEITEKIGIPSDILPEIIETGKIYGNISKEICDELGCKSVPVIAVGTHDTASAVAACPAQEEDFVYISSGTWSLFGTESKKPIINEKSMKSNFTNEIGYGKSIRFLKNIMGLWIIQESRRQWIREGQEADFNTLEKEALSSKPFACFIDVDSPEFEPAGNIPKRIQEFCEKTGQYVPQTRGEIMRCIYESLAMKYKYTFNDLQTIIGKQYKKLYMVGGGIKDKLLCKMTSDALKIEVSAGPTEATATGNAAVSLIAMGEISDLKSARSIISNSIDKKIYIPEQSDIWNEKYSEFLKVIKGEKK